MKITSSLFHAHVKCPTKCWLRFTGDPATGNAYAEWAQGQNESYCDAAIKRLRSEGPQDECAVAPAQEDLQTSKWRLGFDVVATFQNLETRVHQVERVPSEGRGKPAQFIPTRFVFTNKLGKDEKLLLAFDAFVLSEILGRGIGLGKIIHGDDHSTLKVKTSSLAGEVRKRLDKIATLLSGTSPPDLVLNRHCTECEFQARCRQKAIEKDDLSLLATMSEKERQKFRGKGIFTVTQLSYTFRPRRRPKRLRDKREKYHHSLKALAIREKKIHIVGNAELKIEGTPAYLDVECLPDRDFYYLIGVRIGNGESAVQHSLWADTAEDEGKIWREFLAILETIEKPVIVHYGSFEKTFWRRMAERHGKPPEGSKPANAMSSAINLVSFLFAQIYFPTFSNHLKEIASWRGFSWSDCSLFGPNSIACRSEWEESGDPLRKQRLIAYTAEDCKALEILTGVTIVMCQHDSTGIAQPTSEIIVVDKLKPLKRFNLMSKDGAALPEFKEINKAAYWDYQRQRVYVRSSKVIRKAAQQTLKRKARSLRVQGTIEYDVPTSCPRCGGSEFDLMGKTTLLTHDVRFMRSGVKGLVRRQIWPQYHCRQCQQLVRPDGTQFFSIRKYGLHLRAYAVNQLMELRISGSKVAKSLNQILHFELTGSLISQFKSDFAMMYANTVKGLTDRIITGFLVHADETQARMVGKSGYVWVLSSLEEVVYLYCDSREGDMLWTLLENFRGVLVSDFYAVYDSIKCPQQKCLIHLLRDINDDLLKYPFDEDLRTIAQAFADLLKPMIETIDKHGLRKYFMTKYNVAVEKYYCWLAQAHFASEAAVGYVKRFSKYRDKLFTFLKHDGVPWNNNNAENAIRAFGELRDIIKGSATEKGLREYLVLLSICETCKRRGISFIDFLCSGETDLERFATAKSIPSKSGAKQQRAVTAGSPSQETVRKAITVIPEFLGNQPPSRDQWCGGYERERLQKELDAWRRFNCPGHFPWPEIVDRRVSLERYDGMPIGGALAALPALVEGGLTAVEQLFPITVERSMQDFTMALIALASVSRTPSIETLQLLAPAGWKKTLFSERLPDNRTVAELIKLICNTPSNIRRWKAHCAVRFLGKISRLDALLSVNGCRQLFVEGERAGSGGESARRMLLARTSVEPWAEALMGRSFLLVCGRLSSDRRAWLSKRIFSNCHSELGELRMRKMQPTLLNQHRVTVVFGAGGLFPTFFGRLLKMGHHVLSYLLSEESPWPDGEFKPQDAKLLSGQTIRLQFAERDLPLADGVRLREVRCLTNDIRQIGVISSDRAIDLKPLAASLIVEFIADRFQEYLGMHSALDGICEGILDPTQEKANAVDRAAASRSFRAFEPHDAIKEFLNGIKLISFRAENMLAQIIRERVSQPDKAVLMLRDLLSSPADLVPNLKHETLTVRLHPQTPDGGEEAFRHLCSELNPTETVFPATDLRLVFEVASRS